MPRDQKLEVAAINIRIPDDRERNYSSLVAAMAAMRRGVRVYGTSYLAISHFDSETGSGVFSKYTEIDLDGDWFDIDDFDAADPEQIEEVQIPENLKPNLAQFYFRLFEDEHLIVFTSYSKSKSLSARATLRFFREALSWPEIFENFGRVEVDNVQSYDVLDEMLAAESLKEIRIIVRRPNTDDMSVDLANVIERRLKSVNGDELEETYRSKDSGDLTPDEYVRELAEIGIENGSVQTRGLVNGFVQTRTTEESPLIETLSYRDEPELTIFEWLAETLKNKIAGFRRARRAQEV